MVPERQSPSDGATKTSESEPSIDCIATCSRLPNKSKGALVRKSESMDFLGEFLNLKSRYLRKRLRPALMVTWAIPEEYGGMTAMCLKRSSIFHENGTPSAVVTFKAIPELRTRVDRDRSEGKISSKVPVINLHEFYAAFEPRPSEDILSPTPTENTRWALVDRTFRDHDGTHFWSTFKDVETGTLARREFYRPDGTLYLLDCQLPAVSPSRKPRRVLQLFSASRRLIAEFPSTANLHRYWLSELIGDHEADIIVDSAFAARFLWSWEQRGVTKSTVLHTTHVLPEQDPQTGELAIEQKSTIEHRSHWDRVVMLTQTQASAFQRRFDESDNIAVISNPVTVPAELPPWERRNRSKVLIVGRLTEAKRVEKAIEVVEILRDSGIEVQLEIVGNGEHRAQLEALVVEKGLGDRIHFVGHVSDAPARLAGASVALLCSRFEGQSLAVLEAKAYGCVPVVFDVDFGPRDVITHEVSGFLIPTGDSASMADAVKQLVTDDALHRQMSKAAFEEAQTYRSSVIYRRWLKELEHARKHHLIRHELESSVISLVKFALDETGRLQLTIRCSGIPPASTVRLFLQGRKAPQEDRRATFGTDGRQGEEWMFTLSVDDRSMHPAEDPVDLYVELQCEGASCTSRLGVADMKKMVSPMLTGYGNLSIR